MTKKRKICMVTGARSDYGHLYWLMKSLCDDRKLSFQLVVTGMHLSKEFGSTYKMIKRDGFKIDAKVDILHFGYTEKGITQAVGLGCQKFAEVFDRLDPDIVVLLGDRFEMLAACVAAYISKRVIAHIHGGEKTEGLIDEGIRHAITKMATLHFTTTEEYRRRVIQMGEGPGRVYNFGAPGLDHIYQTKLLSKDELQKVLNFKFKNKVAIITYHPVTLEHESPLKALNQMLMAIEKSDIQAIFTKANADPYGQIINNRIKGFCAKHPYRFRLFDNLGQTLYYSCLKHCDVMIGNSSSGLIEAPSFQLPVINIGDRQRNRVKAKNVIDVKETKKEIKAGIKLALGQAFRKKMRSVINPYDRFKDGRTSNRIKAVLKNISIRDSLIKKTFYDMISGFQRRT